MKETMRETMRTNKKPVAAPLTHRVITNAFWTGILASMLACLMVGIVAYGVLYIERQQATIEYYTDATFEAMEEVVEVRKLYEASLRAPVVPGPMLAPKRPAHRVHTSHIASNTCPQ